jgi:Zn-dependent protease
MRKHIQIRLSPFFFVTAFLIGFMGTQTVLQSFIWMAAIFLSIFVHELGHALTAVSFNQSVIIQFTAFGGVTIPFGPKLKLFPEFLMILMGPLFGFSLFILASFLLSINQFADPNIVVFLEALRFINLVWTIINLFPVMPLDGGQLFRIVLEAIFGIKGRRYSVLLGGIFSILIAFTMMLFRAFIPAIFFFFFAFQNFELFQQLRLFSEEDENEPIKEELKEAIQLSKQHNENAKDKLEEVRKHAGDGLVFVIASQELAENYFEAKDYQKAFEILEPLEDKLMDSGKRILLKSAFELKKDDLVLKIAGSILISSPDQELILTALAAAARSQNIDAALGWLQTAKDYGCDQLKVCLEQSFFEEMKKNTLFNEAIKDL